MSTQPCIVLAGGLGTRLRSAVPEQPKCLAPVGRRSFLDIQLDTLHAAGVDEVILSLAYRADMVIDAMAERPQSPPLRHVVEPALMGTGGAIAYAMDALMLDEVLVVNGDTFLDGDLSAMMLPLDRAAGESLRMAVVTATDRTRFGGVQFNSQRVITGFLDKGQSGPGPINAGLYRLCRSALPTARTGAYSLEADVLPGLVARGDVRAAPIDGKFIDIGVPEDYFRFCADHAS